MFLEDRYAYLEIYNFDERDIGEYVMILSSNGERSAPARLRLEVHPKLEMSKEVRDREVVKLHAGRDFHFEVQCSGWPRPVFEATIEHESERPVPLRRVAQLDQYEVGRL
jgi:hypothetical protein